MSQKIEDQINIVERALGERMITHALVVVRAWLNEIGEDNPYEQAYMEISTQYNALFEDWLTAEDPNREEKLDALTGDTYRLMDAVYVSIRLSRGLSPEMHGFNGQNPESVMHYFSSCVSFRKDDFMWLREAMNDESRASIALMAVASLAKNLRECFSEPAILTLIEGINASNKVVSEQCLANVLLLLAHYDVRIDFFPDIQAAFLDAISEDNSAFETLCAIVRATKVSLRDMLSKKEISFEDLPSELQDLLSMTGSENDVSGIASWVPGSENEYMSGIVQILPDTWVYDILVGEDRERQHVMEMLYLSIGRMDLVWGNTDRAEKWLIQRLRSNKATTMDYINYGHCLFLRGDRMMAYENYRQARSMCKSAKEFYTLFRPDRHQLVEHGIPVEQVYLIEDQLFNA
ncbi:MAG: hypothetical protein K6A36_00615 [Paludibacteraceae bacterium]|nr:hypothetical protein [Paludibacteraceae bacterium]